MVQIFGVCFGRIGYRVTECHRKGESGRKVAGAIRSMGNASGLYLECTRVLHETSLVPVLQYGSEIMIRREKERSKIRVV